MKLSIEQWLLLSIAHLDKPREELPEGITLDAVERAVDELSKAIEHNRTAEGVARIVRKSRRRFRRDD